MIPLGVLVASVQAGGAGIKHLAEHKQAVLGLLRIKGGMRS